MTRSSKSKQTTWETCRLSWGDLACSHAEKRITMRIQKLTVRRRESLGNGTDSRTADILGVMTMIPSRVYVEHHEQSERRWLRKQRQPVVAHVVVVRTTLLRISSLWTAPIRRRTSHMGISTQCHPLQCRIREVESNGSLVVVSFPTRRRRRRLCVAPAMLSFYFSLSSIIGNSRRREDGVGGTSV